MQRMDFTRKPEPTERFGFGPTISGYEVIDLTTGRPMNQRIYESAAAANGAAARLNGALRAGPRALRHALGAFDGPPPVEYIGSGR